MIHVTLTIHWTVDPVTLTAHWKVDPVTLTIHRTWTVDPVTLKIHWKVDPVTLTIHWKVDPVTLTIHWTVDPVTLTIHGTVDPVTLTIHWTVDLVTLTIHGTISCTHVKKDCSNIADCSPETRRGSPSHFGAYFIHPLMWIYFIIVNILVFSLLVAMFNSKIQSIEKQATEVWHHQFLQFTMKFYSTLIPPPPFTLLLPFLLYCRRTGKDGPFHQEVVPTELSNLQRIEASGRFKFIQDIDDQEISVVCNGVLNCPHKDDNKNKAPETKTDNSEAQTSNRRPSIAEPNDPNVPRPPESVQSEVTATEDGRTLQEQIIDALSYTEDAWGTIESHAQFIEHLRDMLNPVGQGQANVFAVKNAEGSTQEEIHWNKEATNLSLMAPDMERALTQQDINIITVDPVNGNMSNLRENLTTTPNMEFVSLGQLPLETEGTTLSEIDI
ncbi:hypothetical protein Btru_045510 [Bulinus truncatus]|nr:hypothetical protein Btru_045510 [Bulinus truncatus]